MTRIDELDRIPFERGQRHAIIKIADWWLERMKPREKHREDFLQFLREQFKLEAMRCSVCRRWKPDYDFPLSKHCRSGRNGFCRDCYAKRRAENRKRNLETARRKAREYYAANAEKKAAQLREWRRRRLARKEAA